MLPVRSSFVTIKKCVYLFFAGTAPQKFISRYISLRVENHAFNACVFLAFTGQFREILYLNCKV